MKRTEDDFVTAGGGSLDEEEADETRGGVTISGTGDGDDEGAGDDAGAGDCSCALFINDTLFMDTDACRSLPRRTLSPSLVGLPI